VSPLCPVVSLDSLWAQGCIKLLLHTAPYAGENGREGETRSSELWLCRAAARVRHVTLGG
jgi:hypothetical protein